MFDLIIRGGLIHDGTGAPPYLGDIGIKADRIAGLGDLADQKTVRIIQADGLAVAPGFIDIHSHHDWYLLEDDPMRRFAALIRQGVTTCVVGNCGWTAAPCLPETKSLLLQQFQSLGVKVDQFPWNTMAEYMAWLKGRGLPCNIAQLAGHGAIRIAVMGERNEACTADDLSCMRKLLEESMAAGCVGFSTGLMYYPGMYSRTEELIELAKVASAYGGRYATHLRGYCSTLDRSMREAVTIAEEAKIPVQISHLHAVPIMGAFSGMIQGLFGLFEAVNHLIPLPGLPNPALSKGMKVIQEAINRGIDIGLDIIPYTLGNTTVTALFPPWANRGGVASLLTRLRDPSAKARIKRDILTVLPKWPHWEEGSWSDPYIKAIGWRPIKVLAVRNEANKWAEGMSFVEIGRRWGISPFEALCRLTLEEDARILFTFGFPARPWLEKMFHPAIRHSEMSIGADSVLSNYGVSPPSAFGCFPRVLGHYSRELGLFPMETAIYKMTGLSARRYNLAGRGAITKNAYADLVVFDPHTINEDFYEDGSPAPAKGIAHVFINGIQMLADGELNLGMLPGRILTNDMNRYC